MATFMRASWGIGLALALIGCGGGNGTQMPGGGSGGGPGGRAGSGVGGGAGIGGGAGSVAGAVGSGGGGGPAGGGGTTTGGAGGGAGAPGTGGALGGKGGGVAGAGAAGTGGAAGTAGAGTAGTGMAGMGAGGIAGGGGTALGGAGGSGCKASVSGTVYDPAGTTPLYRAHVYAPSTVLDAVPEGISCTACGTPESGHPLAEAVTDISGQFKLEGVPAGSNVPLVIQLGKWRRQIIVPTVACGDNPLAATLTHLPRNSSEGHLPLIALATGGSSAIECWLRKTGISDGEFTSETGTGRVHLFAGGDKTAGSGSGATQLASGEAFTDAYASLYASPTKLAHYDMLLLGCEGGQYPAAKSPYIANIKAYADGGGRILAEHLQFYWIRSGPAPWPATATWDGAVDDLPTPVTAILDTTSVEGMAVDTWTTALGGVTKNQQSGDQLTVYGAMHSATSVTAPTQQWLTVPPQTGTSGTTTSASILLSFATPVEATSGPQCGRVDFTDMHSDAVPGTGSSDPSRPFPDACKGTAMGAQEHLIEFLFFDTPTCAASTP